MNSLHRFSRPEVVLEFYPNKGMNRFSIGSKISNDLKQRKHISNIDVIYLVSSALKRVFVISASVYNNIDFSAIHKFLYINSSKFNVFSFNNNLFCRFFQSCMRIIKGLHFTLLDTLCFSTTTL